MLAERVKTWTEERKRQGLQQSWQEGRHQGEANVLRRQHARRFGRLPSRAEQCLDQAGEAELESWADGILDAQTLEDVLNRPC